MDDLTNGAINYTDNELKYGTRATHSCDEGYSLTGDMVRTCGGGQGIHGDWSGTPLLCERKEFTLDFFPLNLFSMYLHAAIICTPLEDILNGSIAYFPERIEGANISFSTIATFSCEEGFFLDGDTVSTCSEGEGATGKWTKNTPTCQRELIISIN